MMLKIIPVIFSLALIIAAPAASAKTVDEHILLIPAGGCDHKIIEMIKENLPSRLPMSVRFEILETETLPEAARNAAGQYNAEAVLDEFSKRINLITGNESALIITDSGLYTRNFDFVYGLSDKPRATSVLSTARLKNEFYGLKPDKGLFLKRLMKETLHELGLAWGLEPCSIPSCPMYFSKSLQEIDNKKEKFCHDCQNRLHHRYYSPLVKGFDLSL